MKLSVLFLSMVLMALSCFAPTFAADEGADKQPVFLLCPKHERYGSWSLYLTVDKSDPSKVLNLGLEELKGHNSLDDGGYEKVLAAQHNPSTQREQIGTLDAKSFGAGSLRVEKNNALNVTCTPDGADLKLMIDMRVSADGHFVVGGPDASQRSVVLKYDSGLRQWQAFATALVNVKNGQDVAQGNPLKISGLAFPVKTTGIYEIVAAVSTFGAVKVYDRTDR